MNHLGRRNMSRGGPRRMDSTRSSGAGDLQHQNAFQSRSSQRLPQRKPLTPLRSSARRRSPSPRHQPTMNRDEKRIRGHFDSKDKDRTTGGYRREYWTSSEYNMSAHSAPRAMQTERGGSHRGAFSPRSRAAFRPMPERQPMTDPRYNDYRRRDMSTGYHREMPGRNEAPMRRDYDDSFYGRNGRFDEPNRDAFHDRLVNPRPAQRYEAGDKAVSTSYRGRPSSRWAGYEPRPEMHRPGLDRDRGDWVDVRRPGSPKRREEPEARNQKVDAYVAARRKSFDRPDPRTSYKNLVSSDPPRRKERLSDPRPPKTSPRNPPMQTEAEAPRLTSKVNSNTPRDSVTSSSSTKREFDRELRPEEILVTRKYQNVVERKESVSNVYPDEERHVKIVRESSNEAIISRPGKGLVASTGEGGVKARKTNQKSGKDRDRTDSETSSSVGDVEEAPQMDGHGDTDERVRTRPVKSRPVAVKLRSKLRDFGDKDDRSERPKDTEKEIFGFDSSDDVSQHRSPFRSESRDEEGPRERFDRRVNTRDPDDLRNSLARRRKMQNAEPSERVPENGLPADNKSGKEPARDSVKRRSADNSPSRSRDRRETSPKRRRLSEGHHFRPSVPAFKRPFAVPRRDFSYLSSSATSFRGRRYPGAFPSSGRGLARDPSGRRFPRASFPRGMAFRRGSARQ